MSGKKSGFWKSDWFLGLLVTAAVLGMSGSNLIQGMERKAYDWGVQLTTRTPADSVAVIAIDQASIDRIGHWPWSRDFMASMVDGLASVQAKVIASTLFVSEPQRDAGLSFIDRMVVACGIPSEGELDGATLAGPCGPAVPLLREAEDKLNTDHHLAAAYQRAGSVVVPMQFRLGGLQGQPGKALPDYVRQNALKTIATERGVLLSASGADELPIERLGVAVAAIGHLNVTRDVDGVVRAEPLVLGYADQSYPSLSLAIALRALNLAPGDVKVRVGETVRLGKLKVRTDALTRMRPFYYSNRDGKSPFPVDSFADVASGKIPLENYRDKVVLIGPTVAGIGSTFATPVTADMPSVLMAANAVSSILSSHFIVAPAWSMFAQGLAFVAVTLYLTLLLPRTRTWVAVAVTLALAAGLLATQMALMTTQLIWLPLVAPILLLVLGQVAVVFKRLMVVERGQGFSELDTVGSNRMLGLALQGQGQLELAFDKFRKCPMDDALKDALYGLALEFERKQQSGKAESVLRYLSDFDASFRDVSQRLSRLTPSSARNTPAGLPPGSAAVSGTTAEKPMLGRYQLEKELGKGAMGAVYQGLDPKINRVVAIKTLALSDEFEGDALIEVKERFFREAETAGRLNHPNIVTIFDAGEARNLAYIAMELLKGNDLVPYTRSDMLLPLPQVMSIVARVADALDYAHQNNVVHRDVKPANIMYEADTDALKVTDFGIARITDSARTKTGMVLGTPSYMSPEQLTGQRIDGRSDLFSLGITLYQLVCGCLPFDGDSMAQLMFRIANQPHPDPRTIRPDMPECLARVIDRALSKDPAQRYQSGNEMALELRSCSAFVSGGQSAAASTVGASL